jgi:hypothetical protein
MVTEYVPVGVEEDTDSVDVKLGVPEVGDRLTPDGAPDRERLTVLAKPATDETETVAVVDPPYTIESEVGLMLMVKSFGTKFAVTDLFEFIVIVVGLVVPERSPLQPVNV